VRIAQGTLVLALLGTAAYGADIYRSTAPDGTVSFSDRPQANSEYVFTGTSTPDPRPAAPVTQRGTATATAGPPQAPSIPTMPDGATSTELREQRQKNCDIARERQERYTLSRRLFRTNAAGEREYLDDAATAQAKAKAAQDVQDWCD
jgi:hypothetical protein